jgi:Putative MetA-pathway of phenol degradation
LRLGWNYEAGGGGNVVSGSSGESSEGVDTPGLSRVQKLLYGMKVQVSEQAAWWPDSIAIVQGYTPTGGDATATQLLATYAFGWRLPNRWRWDSSLRFITDSDNGNRFEVWAPSTVLRVPISERFQVHSEFFGLFSEDRASNFSRVFFSPGMHYLITPNWEVGLRLGWGLTQQSSPFFANVGFGLRF